MFGRVASVIVTLLSLATSHVTAYPWPTNTTAGGYAMIWNPEEVDTYCQEGSGGRYSNSDLVASIPNQMGEYHFCFNYVHIERNGVELQAKIVDMTQGLQDDEVLLAPGAFYKIANQSEERVYFTWAE